MSNEIQEREEDGIAFKCGSWDIEGLQEIKNIVVGLKLASKAVKNKIKQCHGSQISKFPRKGTI